MFCCITISINMWDASWLLLGATGDSHTISSISEYFVGSSLDRWSYDRSSFSISVLYILKPNFTLNFFFSWNFKCIVLWPSVLCSFSPFLLNLWHQRTDECWEMLPLRALSAVKGGEKLPKLFFCGQIIV